MGLVSKRLPFFIFFLSNEIIMKRTILFSLLCCLLLAMVPVTLAQAQADKETKIRNAMSAAPPSIADNAAIMDWPAGPGEAMVVLRKGTNAWTCMPDMPLTPGNDPMCVDAPWLEWIDAWASKRAPNITQMGFGYMLQANDSPYSNSNPYATGPMADNEWQAMDVPHLMMLVPDKKMLEGLSTDPDNGGPRVM